MKNNQQHHEVMAYRVNDFCRAFGIGRTKVHELIANGELKSVLAGGRRLIPRDAAETWLKAGASKSGQAA